MSYKYLALAPLALALSATGCSKMEEVEQKIEKKVEEKIVETTKKLEEKLNPFVTLLENDLTPTPNPPVTPPTLVAEQGWTKEQSHWFWHIPQGTAMMPYDWFMALPRPGKDGKGLISDSDYLSRFGFIPSIYAKQTETNPDNLPIGFVKDSKFKNPYTGKTETIVALNCAACHTGQINYKGKGIIIEGGEAMINVTAFQDKISISLAGLLLKPRKFNAFAERVLKEDNNAHNREVLKEELTAFAEKGAKLSNALVNQHLSQVEEGFGRVDALSRIGNIVFGVDLEQYKNLRAIAAPVSYPPIWTVPWFDWAQYNGSIRQPMVRNVGEALGVQAALNLTEEAKLFDSSVHVDNLAAIEKLLEGDKPLQGLKAPKYPEELLGEINTALAEKGAGLYKELCQSCHLPPVNSEEILTDNYWEQPNKYGKRYLKTHNIPVEKIGTDAAAVTGFYQRTADSAGLRLGVIPANLGLQVVTEAVANNWYDKNQISAEKRDEMNGYRENIVTKPLAYRARPLNGVWSTPPYLHNGSVMNIYELLSPYTERTKTFYLGTKEFDPKNLGYVSQEFEGAFKMDTTLSGNYNTGHEFDDFKMEAGAPRQGIIGRKLHIDERYALIEYLKTLH